MVRAAASIDAEARAAMRTTSEPVVARDYLSNPLPFRPTGYQIFVQKRKPSEFSTGGIARADMSKKAEEYQITVGRVLAVGPTALEGRTSSGIEVGNLDPSIKKAQDLVGRWIIFQRFTGLDLRFVNAPENFIVITVSEILGLTDEPDALRFDV